MGKGDSIQKRSSKGETKMTERQEERIPIVGMRKKIYQNLVQSAFTIPHATGMEEVQVDTLIAYKKKIADQSTAHITYLPIIMKIVAQILRKYPIFNAMIDEKTNEIVLKKDKNLGIAVATTEGLIVPVIKRVDEKTLEEIATELQDVTERARQGNLKIADIAGGTFTISNTGARGGTYATPIINFPQVAILGIHAMKERPVILPDRTIGIGTMMGMSLSFDHRIIDGDVVGLFMNDLKEAIENIQ